jgi:serine/threonine-protein kinase RsbT
MNIDSEDDVVLVRRKVKSMAESAGFGSFAVAAVTTAASELTRNVWQYAAHGTATIELVAGEAGRSGIRIRFDDTGPGIANPDRVLEGGYSTNRSLGIGVAGSRRLVDEFELETELGKGTTITVLKWMRRS